MKTITIDHKAFADLLDHEVGEMCTFETNASHILREMSNPTREDGLEELAKGLAFNRRMVNLHLARAEALLTLVYPDFGKQGDGWLDGKLLPKVANEIRQQGFDDDLMP